MAERRIIHIDMDYFLHKEMRDNPTLKGKPVIVGGKASTRGVVSLLLTRLENMGFILQCQCLKRINYVLMDIM